MCTPCASAERSSFGPWTALKIALLAFAAVLALVWEPSAYAQFRPPPFVGGIPGRAQFQALQIQRHQARTLLYREAIEELRKNPAAADVPVCPPFAQGGTRTLCIARPAAAPAAEPAPSDDRPRPPGAEPALPAEVQPTRRRLALLIGNNAYPHPIPSLETPISDVEGVAALLQRRYGFETRVLRNARKAEIVEAMNTIADGAHMEDSVLLFYAGHGYLLDDTRMGFWLPVDASEKTAANWISNSDIAKMLQAIPSRQLLLVSDSCFSGTLAREQKLLTSTRGGRDDILRRRTVMVFSSGDEEPVSDAGRDGHSVFAYHLLRTMTALEEGTVVGFDVYSAVREGVIADYPQSPQYGALLTAGHMGGGEYLFRAGRD